MTAPVYEQLGEAFRARGTSIPAPKCPELDALLEELFTPEEAEIAARMPLAPTPLEAIAQGIARNPQEVERFLEAMADKGLVFTHEPGGVRRYYLMPLLPGIFEMQFMTGEVNERTKKLARLFQDYSEAMFRLGGERASTVSPYPWARVLTVEQDIPAEVEIYPYDKVSEYIANSAYITVATCYCRHHGELLDHPCDKPKDVCLSFGNNAKYIAERGFGRFVSKEEAVKILDRSEKAGLVHCCSNIGGYIDFICNCCICHCGILMSLKNAAMPSMAATSGFITVVDKDECMGCGDCIERCPMEAISMQDDIAASDADRCIGCGLCISVCPTAALKMEPRDQRPSLPRNRTELNMATMASMRGDEAAPGEEERK